MRNIKIYHLFLIAAIGLLAYSNVLNVPFVFDDLNVESGIVRNPVIKDLDNFISSFKGYEYNPRRFVGYLTFALNYHVGGLDVTGYHIVNLAIHIVNAVLVYFLVLRTFQTPYFSKQSTAYSLPPTPYSLPTAHYSHLFAFAVALLFVSHPIQTQAVTYIVQRFTSLATLFYLMSLVLYLKGRLSAQKNKQYEVGSKQQEDSKQDDVGSTHPAAYSLLPTAYYFLSLISAVLAMKTKEIAVTLPILMLFYEFVFFKSTLKKKLMFLVPVLLILVVLALSMFHIDKPLGEALAELSKKARVQTDMARGDYLMTEMRVIVTYIRLIFFPVNQNLYYDYPIYHSLFNPQVFLSFLFLSALFVTAIYLLYKSRQGAMGEESKQYAVCSRQTEEDGKKTAAYCLLPTAYSAAACLRLIAFGILWFFLTLSVESSVIPIEDVIFEHRLYLPSVGAFIAIAAFLSFVAGRVKGRPWMGKMVIPGFVVLIVALAAVTWTRNIVWQDEVALMEDVALKSPLNAKVRNGLGHAYMTKGWNDKAIEQFLAAIALRQDYARAHNSLGVVYGKKGMLEEALEEFSYALSLEPRKPEIYNNIGVVYRAKGDTNREITYFQAALEFDPNLALTHFNLAMAYAARGWKEKADEHFRKAHELAPDTY